MEKKSTRMLEGNETAKRNENENFVSIEKDVDSRVINYGNRFDYRSNEIMENNCTLVDH